MHNGLRGYRAPQNTPNEATCEGAFERGQCVYFQVVFTFSYTVGVKHNVLFSSRTGQVLIKHCIQRKRICSNYFPVSPFSDSYKSIVEFIDAQFEAYLQEELKIKRTLHSYHDTRIHACLYFIAPTGHSLKSLDLVTMKKLDSKVNFT